MLINTRNIWRININAMLLALFHRFISTILLVLILFAHFSKAFFAPWKIGITALLHTFIIIIVVSFVIVIISLNYRAKFSGATTI
jgi:hypothetical protein